MGEDQCDMSMEYSIKQDGGLFEVHNATTKRTYLVSVDMHYCTCKAWFYAKEKRGKKWCKHLRMVKGLKQNQL